MRVRVLAFCSCGVSVLASGLTMNNLQWDIADAEIMAPVSVESTVLKNVLLFNLGVA